MCVVSILFDVRCLINATFYYSYYHCYCYYHWHEGLDSFLDRWPILFLIWEYMCMRFVRHAITLLSWWQWTAHLTHCWDFLAHIPGSSVKCWPWHWAAHGVFFRARGCVPSVAWAPRRRACDSFSSPCQLPCLYARACEATSWRFVLWANLNHGENMKENEQLKNTL